MSRSAAGPSELVPSPRVEECGDGPDRAAGRSRLCVGMATYDDFDGVWFTVQALRMGHPDLADRLSFLVVDNHPESPAGTALRSLESQIPGYRYVSFSGFRGTAVRDLVFREADADVVCCVDSHVLVRPGSLAVLLAWFDEHPDSPDLVQGPLWYDDLGDNVATHFAPRWGAGMFGQWNSSPSGCDTSATPFEIEMQGLGLFACRRAAWPGLNPRFRGFGGEEGYLHEKFRRRGGRVLCHPAVRWAHRFQRPTGVPYTNVWEDRVRNYLFGWTELGWDTTGIEAHFRAHIANDEATTTLLDRAWRQVRSPFSSFDAIFCAEGLAPDVLAEADVAWRLEEVPLPDATHGHQRTPLLWRRVLTDAQRRGYASVLIVDEPCDVDQQALAKWLEGDQPWDVLRLIEPGADPAASTPATAVRAVAYERLLQYLQRNGDGAPGSFSAARDWLPRVAACSDDAPPLRLVDAEVVVGRHGKAELDRPCRTNDLRVSEAEDGIVVTDPRSGAVCHLNQTAALVFQLSWGLLTIRQIAGVLADEFCLAEAPVREVQHAVAALRDVCLLT